jgi:hypothetical protein
MKFWDGEKDDMVDVRLNQDGKWEPVNGSMEGLDTSLKPDSFHEQIYAEATQHLAKLEVEPKSADAIENLKGLNDKIMEHNKSLGLGEEHWQDCCIIFTVFSTTFELAAPYRARLKKSHADTEALKRFDELNTGLSQFNSEHHYPATWVMVLPAEESGEVRTQPTSEGKSTETTQIVTLNGRSFRRSAQKPGYITENGVSKQIEAYVPVGYGHQLLLRERRQRAGQIRTGRGKHIWERVREDLLDTARCQAPCLRNPAGLKRQDPRQYLDRWSRFRQTRPR